jgi:hypothetical protein
MEQLTIAGVGILLILASWQFMVVTSLTDACVDRLKVLRNQTDIFFAKHGTANANTAHVKRALDGLLDAEIRNLRNFSIMKIVIYKAWAERHREETKTLHAQTQAKFATNDPEVSRFVAEIRSESARAIAWYVCRRHLSLWIAVLFAVPVVIVHHGFKRGSSLLNQAIKEVIEQGAKRFKNRVGVQQSIEDSFLQMDASQDRHLLV